MPYPLVPPPAGDTGALVWPRMLQRWLDVNRITKLTRTSTYIQLPVFNQGANTWIGYSDIVEAFNFEGPNNISFSSFVTPVNPNYSLTVAYRVGTQVVRYTLWNAVGSVITVNTVPYTGQPILKNFRLEVWNSSQGAASEANGVVIYTSKLGGIDYRWGGDSVLVGSDVPPCTNFYNINNVVQLLNPSLWFKSSGLYFSGGSLISWTDAISNVVITSSDGGTTTEGTLNNINLLNLVPADLRTGVGFFVNASELWIGLQITSGSDHIIDSTLFYIAYDGANFNISGSGSYQVAAPTGVFYVLRLSVTPPNGVGNSTLTLSIYNANTSALVGSTSYQAPAAFNNMGKIYINENATMVLKIMEMQAYGTQFTDYQYETVLGYFQQLFYNAMSLPLTFPANSASVSDINNI